MPASWAASLEIGEKVRLADGAPADPLTLSIRTVQSGGLLPLNSVQVIRVLAVGLKHAGCNWNIDRIGDLIYGELTLPTALTVCGDYLAAFCAAADPGAATGPTEDEGKQ